MKLTPKQHQTSKLFYNKWPFKLVFDQPGASLIRYHGLHQSVEYAVQGGQGLPMHQKKRYNWTELSEFLLKLKIFIDADLKMRFEGSSVSIFCRDKDLNLLLKTELKKWLYEIHAPATDHELEFLVNQTSRKIVRDSLPHSKYKFRVNLRHNTDINTRNKFRSWINNYGDKIKIASHTEHWFEYGSSGYGCNPSLYVEDSATLSMIGLFLGTYVRSTEEFILRSSINTHTDQEELCQL
jgi:hypothetical protein